MAIYRVTARASFVRVARLLILGSLAVVSINPAQANPINAVFVDDLRCDAERGRFDHELGELVFPTNESIDTGSFTTAQTTCVNNPAIPDYEVRMTNTSGRSWVDLFFVADAGLGLGNSDGTVNGANAFRIDDAGINAPLIGGDGGIPLRFEPGETWVFLVTDFTGGNPIFGSLGVPSTPIGTGDASNASIVARCAPGVAGGGGGGGLRCVPEPPSLTVLLVGAFAVFCFAWRYRLGDASKSGGDLRF